MSWFSRLAYAVLWLFIFSIPSEKILEIPNLGTMTRLIGFAAVGAGILALGVEQRVRIPSLFHVIVSLFMLWAYASSHWTVGMDFTEARRSTYIQLLVMVMLLWQFADSEQRLRGLMAAYSLGTIVNFADTVRRYLEQDETMYQRYATTGFDPNDLALTLALSLPLSYYVWLHGKTVWRWIFPVQMLWTMSCIFLTASRGGTMCMLLALTFIFWTRNLLSTRARVALIFCGVTALAGILPLVPATTWKRLATLGSEVSEGTLNNRTVIWRQGWEDFAEHALVGVGTGAYPNGPAVVHQFGHRRMPGTFTPVAHNTFFSILTETGVIGFGLFAWMLFILVSGVRKLRGADRALWLTLLAVWSLGVMSLTWEERKPTWLLFALVLGHTAARRIAPSAEDRDFRLIFAPALQPKELAW